MNNITKKCFKCEEVKAIDQFYRHNSMADFHLNKCKECVKADVREHRKNNDSVREYDKDRYHNDVDRKFKLRKTSANWINNNPEARKAHWTLYNAVKAGKIIKQPCQICGDTYRIHGHHKDYSKPLEVEWLCAKHHQRLHNAT